MSETLKNNPVWLYIRSMLILGRVSNLPTVWSNCLAGWILAGNTDLSEKFFVLLSSATLFYVGGMYWNDTMDIEWDREKAPERPIPSGAIPLRHAWIWGGFLFTCGFGLALFLGTVALLLSTALFVSILIYDWSHKRISWAPVIMASCRFWLILFAAASAFDGRPISGFVLWSAVFLFCYIVGLSYIARHERLATPFDLWPLMLLSGPAVWGFIANSPSLWTQSIVFAVPFLAWTAWALSYLLIPSRRQPGKAVSLLLSGIVLTDVIAIQPLGGPILIILVALFASCQVLQKWIPAT